MNRWRCATILLASGLLLGCSYTAHYERMSWASTSLEQAQAECEDLTSRPNGPANMYLCMRPKGWNLVERY